MFVEEFGGTMTLGLYYQPPGVSSQYLESVKILHRNQTILNLEREGWFNVLQFSHFKMDCITSDLIVLYVLVLLISLFI